MSRRRVLLYSDGPVFSGAERYLIELARGLPKDRFDVELVCAEDGAVDGMAAEASEMGVACRRLPSIPTLSQRGPFLKVLRFFATHRPDVLHFNLADPRACNGAMTAARMALRGHFVVTEHLPHSNFDDRPLPFRHRLAAKNTALTIVNCESHRATVLARKHHRGRVEIVPNGVADPGEPTDARRLAARATLGISDHQGPVIGWVGRFEDQKNPDLMVEGIRRVAEHRPDALFVWLGDGSLIEPTRQRVSELGLIDRCRFYGHRPDARTLMIAFDLLVNTSWFEGMPFTILEAAVDAVPVVAPNIAGMDALVADRASGVLVPPGDGDVLGEAMLGLLSDTNRLQQIGRVARERARTLFSLEAMCERTATLYEEI